MTFVMNFSDEKFYMDILSDFRVLITEYKTSKIVVFFFFSNQR